MVTKFGGQILATKFGFVPDCWLLTCDTDKLINLGHYHYQSVCQILK